MPALRSIVLVLMLGLANQLARAGSPPTDPFAAFELPRAWQEAFWSSPDVQALAKLEPKWVAHLVPTQSGLRFCRCPSCDANELDEPLAWSVREPDVITCKKCQARFPNDKIPAPDKDKKIPEETVEVLPGLVHHYPYHLIAPERQRYPDERLYLAARRDHEAQAFLAKVALYAAVRVRDHPGRPENATLARLASTILLRFAQVYPSYALHFDQPGQAKALAPARQPPPYRRGYGTAKWDWSGGLEIPLNLVIAYALIRDRPELAEAGVLLKDSNPRRTIERDLLRASAAFALAQPEESGELALQVDRGLLAVGRLLHDDDLVRAAIARLKSFAEKGFYFDGLGRQVDPTAQKKLLGMLDGWFEALLAGEGTESGVERPSPSRSVPEAVPMLSLARAAGANLLADSRPLEILQASLNIRPESTSVRHPGLLGGAGVARLAVGEGATALDLELRGLAEYGQLRSRRQSLRLAIGGQTVLGDLDDLPPRSDGWDRASASHNTVIVDGLNHRESVARIREATPGGDFLFYAADPDFQVAVLDDPRAYPQTTTRFRQTLVTSSNPKSSYAVSVFEVEGGSQHDQVFHGAVEAGKGWAVSVPVAPGPGSLLAPNIPYVETASVDDGRWLVQAYGEFARMASGVAERPALASLAPEGHPGVRLHLLGDAPFRLITATTPRASANDEPGRPALLVRRASTDGTKLRSTFVTLFEPSRESAGLLKVGRMTETPGFVVLYVETADGPEHLVINLKAGVTRSVTLADGRSLTTDGWVVRARRNELALAGGTVATLDGRSVRQAWVSGKVLAAARFPTPDGRGWFETDQAVPDAQRLIGRTLLIRHGDQTTHGWTLTRLEPQPAGRLRLYVREEPGFLIEGPSRLARYYQFPRNTAPGPHLFSVATIAR